MAQYLRLFETVNEFNSAYTGEEYIEPWVSYTEENEKVDYNKVRVTGNNAMIYIDYDGGTCSIIRITDDFTYDETDSSCTITFRFSDGTPDKTYVYGADCGGEWCHYAVWNIGSVIMYSPNFEDVWRSDVSNHVYSGFHYYNSNGSFDEMSFSLGKNGNEYFIVEPEGGNM